MNRDALYIVALTIALVFLAAACVALITPPGAQL